MLFIVKYEKITLFDEFLVLLGHIISRYFACSNVEKINKNNNGCLLESYLYDFSQSALFLRLVTLHCDVQQNDTQHYVTQHNH